MRQRTSRGSLRQAATPTFSVGVSEGGLGLGLDLVVRERAMSQLEEIRYVKES